MITRQFEIGKPASDRIPRTGDFELLPLPALPPIITSQPANNISQQTWIKGVRRGRLLFQRIRPLDGIFKVVEGTELRWTFFAHDPNKNIPQTPNLGLTYKWKKDGIDITAVNLLNAERGVRSIKIAKNACTPELSGEYVCEVSNQYGITETLPLRLRVFSPRSYPKLFVNLLKNGNADSSTDGWTIEPGIVTSRFLNSTDAISIPQLGHWYKFRSDYAWEAAYVPGTTSRNLRGEQFRFTSDSEPLLNALLPWIERARLEGQDWRQWPEIPYWITQKNDRFSVDQQTNFLPEFNRWVIGSGKSVLVRNEHPSGEFRSFFPSMQSIDEYNKNSEVVGLLAESAGQQLSYFTREKIKFEKFGGKAVLAMRQQIDLTDLADFIDGNVFGVSNLTSQFFAYVGLGITRYRIRITKPNDEIAELNWCIANAEDFYDNITGADYTKGKIAVKAGSDIEIIPLTDDETEVLVNYLNQNGDVIRTDTIKGPESSDIWAVKEKAFFPLSLGPIFMFLSNALSRAISLEGNEVEGCNVKVFGQTVTTTNALRGMFTAESPFVNVESATESSTTSATANLPSPTDYATLQTYHRRLIQLPSSIYAQSRIVARYGLTTYNSWRLLSGVESANSMLSSFLQANRSNLPPLPIELSGVSTPTYTLKGDVVQNITDVRAKLIGYKFPVTQWKNMWPTYWDITSTAASFPKRKRMLRSLKEEGAAAMFGIELTKAIPTFTRSVEVVVKFIHKSDTFFDPNPEIKKWTNQELYLDNFGQDTGNSRRVTEYGNPKCGITKMKFIVVPNNFAPQTDYPSYKLPPAENTVLGLSRRYMLSSNINSASPSQVETGFQLQDSYTSPPSQSIFVAQSNTLVENSPAITQFYLDQLSNQQDVDLLAGRESEQQEEDSAQGIDTSADGHGELESIQRDPLGGVL